MSIPAPFYKGKVRNLYDVDGSSMIMEATDRISAFDVVFPNTIPEKGKILNSISNMWMEAIRNSDLPELLSFSDHMISTNVDEFPEPFRSHEDLRDRSVLVKKTERIDFECVVRGYIAGSGWKEYQKTGAISGHSLPDGMRLAEKLPEPIFTPSTKASDGEHDENVSISKMMEIAGKDLTTRLENISIELYKFAADIMSRAGIILCDTKFEFGLNDGEIVLIDEVLTPDSSRYWDAARYKIGESPASFDKQYIRDFMDNSDWNKEPPAPPLPDDVIAKTGELYGRIETLIAGALNQKVLTA